VRNRKFTMVIIALLCCSLFLSGGCIDAITKGLTSGVTDGLAAIIEDFLQNLASTLSVIP